MSCVLEEVQRAVTAKPMILSDETRPTNFTFTNQVGVQTDEKVLSDVPLDELGRTIQKPLVVGQFGNVIWHHTYHVINFQVATATSIQMDPP